MKMTGSLGVLSMAAVLGIALSQTLRSEESRAQPDSIGINGISTAGADRPPVSTLPAELNPNRAFAELVRLLQAGVEPDVILVYIDSTLRLYELDADDIIYLTDLGAPAEVIKAAMEHDRKLIEKSIPVEAEPQQASHAEEVAEDIEEPPAEVTVNYFYDTLAPYGVWVDVDGYGRWFRHSPYGWCWWPDTYWAPSWVCWRYDRSYCGWAPLPPHAVYRSGVGFIYRGSSVSVGFDFDLSTGYSNPQPRPAKKKQAPAPAPRKQEEKKSTAPPGNKSVPPVRKQPKSSGSTQQAGKSSSHTKKPPPATPPKGKGSAQNRKPTQNGPPVESQ